jgi:hypothetical protein
MRKRWRNRGTAGHPNGDIATVVTFGHIVRSIDRGKIMLNRYFFREWRRAAGLSLRELAVQIGHSYPKVNRIETGDRDFDGVYLADFARVIGCSSIADPLTRLPDMYVIIGNRMLSDAAHKEIARRARELQESVNEAATEKDA